MRGGIAVFDFTSCARYGLICRKQVADLLFSLAV